jgi:hypothetical protein
VASVAVNVIANQPAGSGYLQLFAAVVSPAVPTPFLVWGSPGAVIAEVAVMYCLSRPQRAAEQL